MAVKAPFPPPPLFYRGAALVLGAGSVIGFGGISTPVIFM